MQMYEGTNLWDNPQADLNSKRDFYGDSKIEKINKGDYSTYTLTKLDCDSWIAHRSDTIRYFELDQWKDGYYRYQEYFPARFTFQFTEDGRIYGMGVMINYREIRSWYLSNSTTPNSRFTSSLISDAAIKNYLIEKYQPSSHSDETVRGEYSDTTYLSLVFLDEGLFADQIKNETKYISEAFDKLVK